MAKKPKKLFKKKNIPDLTFEEIMALHRVEGQEIWNSQIYRGRMEGTQYKSSVSGARVVIKPSDDGNIGLAVYDDENNKIFETVIDGADVGDVNIGDVAGGNGIKYDKSAGVTELAGQEMKEIINRANSIYNDFTFVGNYNDGLTEITDGASTLVRELLTTKLTSVGDDCILASVQSAFTALVDHEINVSAKVNSITNQDVFLGVRDNAGPIPEDFTDITRHMGFFIADGALYASNADNSNQTKTEITGITLTNFNTYRIVLDAGVSIKFYINDVLEATHTTNIPGAGHDPRLYFGITQQTTGTKILEINNNYLLISS